MHDKLKPGTRIAVYDATEEGLHRTIGTVRRIIEKENVIIFDPDLKTISGAWYVHPKQCRRLKKKKLYQEFNSFDWPLLNGKILEISVHRDNECQQVWGRDPISRDVYLLVDYRKNK